MERISDYAKEMIPMMWASFPSIMKTWFPTRWNLPHGYMNPELMGGHIVSQILMKSRGAIKEHDRVFTTWATLHGNVEEAGGARVYIIEKDLAEDLRRTDPKGLKFTDLKAPLPVFMVLLPAGAFPTETDGDVLGVMITLKEDYLMVAAHMEVGSSYTYSALIDDVEILTSLDSGQLMYQEGTREFVAEMGCMTKDDLDQGSIRRIAVWAINLLAYLNVAPQDVEGSGGVKHIKQKKKEAPKRDYATPWIIGKRYRAGGRSGSTGHSVRAHWRSGHWRRQAVGQQRSLRKLIYIQPILVNAGSGPSEPVVLET